MSVALVVLNYNDYENTQKYVEVMKTYNVIDKIIIVDNKSSNEGELDKLDVLKNDKIDIVQTDKNGGYAYGNNYGLRYIDNTYENRFDYIIISNPDISVEEDTIEKVIKFMSENINVAIASPRMHFPNGPARRSAWKKRTFLVDVASSTRITEILLYPFLKKGEFRDELKEDILKVFATAGSFFIAKHDKFKEVGYFDENTFLFFEEDILGAKMYEKGYEIYNLNNLKFIHYDSQCIGRLMNMFRKQDILFDSRIYYHKKYNKINSLQICVLQILRYVRKLELLFEVPLKKALYKKRK